MPNVKKPKISQPNFNDRTRKSRSGEDQVIKPGKNEAINSKITENESDRLRILLVVLIIDEHSGILDGAHRMSAVKALLH